MCGIPATCCGSVKKCCRPAKPIGKHRDANINTVILHYSMHVLENECLLPKMANVDTNK